MKMDSFFRHHGIQGNPFVEEDAQSDTVFKTGCLGITYHPAWSKFFGNPADPSTALIFGEKGSGKTALRLQAASSIAEYNQANPESRVFLISYDDFNPFLDQFAQTVKPRDPAGALTQFQLQDHLDAILALGVTQLLDALLSKSKTAGASKDPASILEIERDLTADLSPDLRRDLLMLAAYYDASTRETQYNRWSRLRRLLGVLPWWGRRETHWGLLASLVVIAGWYVFPGLQASPGFWIGAAILALGWTPQILSLMRMRTLSASTLAGLRVLMRDPHALSRALNRLGPANLAGQPAPTIVGGPEARYELLRKLLGVLKGFRHNGILVIIDRVDEPQLIEGDPRRMRALIWPLLDNKCLRHPGIGFKMLLPIELAYYLEKEDRDFYERARPDKLNMIKPLRWSGSALYDLATDRLIACSVTPAAETANPPAPKPRLRHLIDDAISDDTLKDNLSLLRTPRQLFKFLHRLIEEHCQRHTEDNPRYRVDPDTFRLVYATYLRDIEAFDRGFGHG